MVAGVSRPRLLAVTPESPRPPKPLGDITMLLGRPVVNPPAAPPAPPVIEHSRCRQVLRQGFERPVAAATGRKSPTPSAPRAVLDAEIVCLKADGRSDFYALCFGTAGPTSTRSTCCLLEGKDLRHRPLLERTRRLAQIIPYDFEAHSSLLGHVPEWPDRVGGTDRRFRSQN